MVAEARISGGVFRVWCATARRQIANPALKFGRFDNCGFSALSCGQSAVADGLKNFCAADARTCRRLIGAKAQARNRPTCYVRLKRIHGGAPLRLAALSRTQWPSTDFSGL